MNKLTENIWIGNSDDAHEFDKLGAGALLNVAQDLPGQCFWPEVEYAQVGLVDGPGNEVVDYCAAILTLVGLSRRHEVVAVYDHDGGRAFAVAMMYLNLVGGKYRPEPLAWSHWLTWEERLEVVGAGEDLPTPHSAHREAFARIPFGVLEALL